MAFKAIGLLEMEYLVTLAILNEFDLFPLQCDITNQENLSLTLALGPCPASLSFL